jgi:hypothetical protein
MDVASKILVVGGVLNLMYGLAAGFILGYGRHRPAEAASYMSTHHMPALLQGPMLLGLVFAVVLSTLPETAEEIAAIFLVAASGLLIARDVMIWALRNDDSDAAGSTPAFVVGIASTVLSVGGIGILAVGVFKGL